MAGERIDVQIEGCRRIDIGPGVFGRVCVILVDNLVAIRFQFGPVCIEDQVEPGSLSGRYFCDTNDNDVDDGQAIDPGVAGILVTAFDADGNVVGTDTSVLERLNGLGAELGFNEYTDGSKSTIDGFFITMALMFGTAGLPHVIVRLFNTPMVIDLRKLSS